MLARHPQGLLRRGQHSKLRRRAERAGHDLRYVCDQVLTVVEHEQGVALTQRARQHDDCFAVAQIEVGGTRDRGHDLVGRGERRQLDPPHSMRMCIDPLARYDLRKPRLADAARSDDSDDTLSGEQLHQQIRMNCL